MRRDVYVNWQRSLSGISRVVRLFGPPPNKRLKLAAHLDETWRCCSRCWGWCRSGVRPRGRVLRPRQLLRVPFLALIPIAGRSPDLRPSPGPVADTGFVAVSGGRLYYESIGSGPKMEEHTSELQSQSNLVCRLLLEKKKAPNNPKPLQKRL